jgi:hypothetical protein
MSSRGRSNNLYIAIALLLFSFRCGSGDPPNSGSNGLPLRTQWIIFADQWRRSYPVKYVNINLGINLVC